MTLALLRKELRAFAPAWLALSSALFLTGSNTGLSWLTLPIYFVGTCTLGALSLGYEYANDTLQQSLTLPLRRSRVLLVKQLALGVAVVTFVGVSYLVVTRFLVRDWRTPTSLLLVGAVFGLFVAPWLTIVLRNPLGGAVFSILLPALLALIGESMGARLYGQTEAAHAFTTALVRDGTIAFGIVSAAMIWPTFSRLEILGPRGLELQPAWRSSRAPAVANASSTRPLWLLISKELHLHQLAAALAVVYAVASVWIGLTLRDDWKFIVSLGTTEFYAGFVAVLAGAVVTAEERTMGTLDWQASLPFRRFVAWLIKVGVAVNVALALGIVWPFLIHLLATSAIRVPDQISKPFVLAVLAVVLGAVYLSSLCRSALAAAVIAVPAFIAFYAFMWYFAGPAEGWILHRARIWPSGSTNAIATWLLFVGLGGLSLRFAYVNHRASDRPLSRIATQIAALAAANVAVFVVSPILSVWID